MIKRRSGPKAAAETSEKLTGEKLTGEKVTSEQ